MYKDIVVELKASNEDVLVYIIELYADDLYRVAFAILKDQFESEDLVQEVIIKIWNERFNLEDRGEFAGLLYIMTKRISLNRLRNKHLARRRSSQQVLEDYPDTATMATSDVKDMKRLEEYVINILPEQQRKVYLLSRKEGLTYKEIADKLNIEPNTVKNHLVQALKKFRTYFRKFDYYTFILFFF